MMKTGEKPRHLYVHVPFCRSICFYCDFCRTVYTKKKADAWLGALEKELAGRQISKEQETVYIGGGTPVSLDALQLERLLILLSPYTALCTEYTVEINPECLDEEKAALLGRYGVNRASIGYQTDDPVLLKLMNRHHSPDDVEKAMKMLRNCGIENLSLDIMYSLPDQTPEGLERSVERALEMEPDHVSLYSLTIEVGTVFAKRGLKPCDEEMEADMYEWICARLPESGYVQYEISNFAKEDRMSRHNLGYWDYEDFYGVSCGASGMENGLRYDNTASLDEYLRDPFQRTEIPLSGKDMMFEFLMMGLRKKEGIRETEFERRFGMPVCEAFPGVLEEQVRNGFLTRENGYLKATGKGFAILNTVLEAFL